MNKTAAKHARLAGSRIVEHTGLAGRDALFARDQFDFIAAVWRGAQPCRLRRAGRSHPHEHLEPVADRLRERGYNQADLIARPLARRLGVKLRPDVLVRTRPRPPQLVLSRTERWKSVRGAYATREGVRVDKLRVLLVDDVMTTGATLDSCARALRKAGAAEVFGLTVARLVPGWSPSAPPQ